MPTIPGPENVRRLRYAMATIKANMPFGDVRLLSVRGGGWRWGSKFELWAMPTLRLLSKAENRWNPLITGI